jgi:hypothetical protein
MGHGLKAARLHPTLRLLINVLPGRQVMGHHAPLAAATHDVAQRVEKLAQRIVPLGRIFLHQHQVGTAKVPFCIAAAPLEGSIPSLLLGPSLVPLVISELPPRRMKFNSSTTPCAVSARCSWPTTAHRRVCSSALFVLSVESALMSLGGALLISALATLACDRMTRCSKPAFSA